MSTRLRSSGDLAELLGVEFSDEQLAAICAPLAPGVIIAGAGTGKTTVMAARVVWLVGTGQVRPDQVLGLTFTRKAAAELSQRVAAALRRAAVMGDPADESEPLVQTYDAFAGSLVNEHGLLIGVESDQRLITGATRYRLAAEVVARTTKQLPVLARRWRPATVADRLLKLDAELRAHLVDGEMVRRHDRDFDRELDDVPLTRGKPLRIVTETRDSLAARAELLGLVDEYRELKRQLGLVEFADQMAQAADLADRSPGLARQLRGRFQVVLLDEYQDTSAAQAKLLQGLFSGSDAENGRGHPVTAVGDPFQAIYGWRGAAPSNILQFAADFPSLAGTPADQFSLQVNRRSRPLILSAANRLAAPLRSDERLRPPGGQVAEGAQELRAPEGGSGGQIEVATFDTWPQEVAWLADQVVAAKDSGQVTQWSEIAVLTRSNAPIGALYEALTARDVPVEIVGLGGLLELPEIAEIVATLTLIDDVTANPEVVRLLSGPRWRIGPRDLLLLAERARALCRSTAATPGRGLAAAGANLEVTDQLCLLDAVDDLAETPISASARQRLADFASELRALRRHRDSPVLELVHRVIEVSGVGLELEADGEWFATGRARQLVQFTDAVDGYVDLDGDGALSGLLAWLQAEREEAQGLDQAVPSSAQAVKLLTAHRSKGLEWDLVFLPGLRTDAFPSTLPPDNWVRHPQVLPNELRGDRDWVPQLTEVTKAGLEAYPGDLRQAQRQAEDRLIYVAATRARQRLVATLHHWYPGRKTANLASPYFEVLRELAADHGGLGPIAEVSATNPLGQVELQLGWPAPLDQQRRGRLTEAAAMVQQARLEPMLDLAGSGLDADVQAQRWHQLAQALVADLRASRQPTQVLLPESVSASGLLQANRNPADFASQLLRPMPRPVGRQAGVGTRFHQWLEQRFGVATLFDPAELDLEPDETDHSAADLQLRRLTIAFDRGRYANRIPESVEEPFILLLAGQQIRGRIDAIFATPDDPDHDYQVVDWKTSGQAADPLQLSIYRLAWARSVGVPLHRVDAAFYHVLSDQLERPEHLLDGDELVGLLDRISHEQPVNHSPSRSADG